MPHCVRENSFSHSLVEPAKEKSTAQENAAPEGRPSLAQRFSAGKSGKKDSSPGGTTEFSRTLSALGKLPLHEQEVKGQQNQQKSVHAEHDGRRKQRNQPSRQ